MPRKLLLLAIGMAIGASAAAVAFNHEDGESVKVIGTHDMKETVDGKAAKATAVEVTIGPGQTGLPHRHPGPGLVYVIEGEYELGIDYQPTKRFRAGESFYEPTGCLHRVSKNPSATGNTRLIAFILHPPEAKDIAVPENTKK